MLDLRTKASTGLGGSVALCWGTISSPTQISNKVEKGVGSGSETEAKGLSEE